MAAFSLLKNAQKKKKLFSYAIWWEREKKKITMWIKEKTIKLMHGSAMLSKYEDLTLTLKGFNIPIGC